jgi:hypothetical protein
MIVSELIDFVVVPVTVTTAVPETAPVNPDMLAVTVVEPAETAVTSPEELTDATAWTLEDQVTKLVTFLLVEG